MSRGSTRLAASRGRAPPPPPPRAPAPPPPPAAEPPHVLDPPDPFRLRRPQHDPLPEPREAGGTERAGRRRSDLRAEPGQELQVVHREEPAHDDERHGVRLAQDVLDLEPPRPGANRDQRRADEGTAEVRHEP